MYRSGKCHSRRMFSHSWSSQSPQRLKRTAPVQAHGMSSGCTAAASWSLVFESLPSSVTPAVRKFGQTGFTSQDRSESTTCRQCHPLPPWAHSAEDRPLTAETCWSGGLRNSRSGVRCPQVFSKTILNSNLRLIRYKQPAIVQTSWI